MTGTGRCGSSMAMQMLAAAGVPVTGHHPGHELDTPSPVDDLSRAELVGRAVKLLDLPRHHGRIPRSLQCRWIVVQRRSRREQAKSQRKFVQSMVGVDVPWSGLDRLEASLAHDDLATLDVILGRREPNLHLWFEDVLADPLGQATRLVRFVDAALGLPLHADAARRAAAVVMPRSARCATGFLEAELIERRGA